MSIWVLWEADAKTELKYKRGVGEMPVKDDGKDSRSKREGFTPHCSPETCERSGEGLRTGQEEP